MLGARGDAESPRRGPASFCARVVLKIRDEPVGAVSVPRRAIPWAKGA